jgi:HEAT repeat protein
MNFSKWFGGKKSSQAETGNPKANQTGQGSAALGYAEVVRMLEQMLSEEIDTSDFDLDKLRESVAVGQRQAQMLKRRGKSLIPGLSRATSHADPRVRGKSCWSLQILGSDSGLPDEALIAIANLSNDKEQIIRQQAVHSLGALSKTANLEVVLPQLVTALKSNDVDVRKSTAETLGQMGIKNTLVLESLHQMLHDQNVDVAEASRAAFLKLGGKLEAPAAGSVEEVERLVGLTTSSDYDIKKKAWADLEKIPDRESTIAPLMNAFRRYGGKAMGVNLPKFLGKVGMEACRDPLLEIHTYASDSSDDWERESLDGSACVALLTLKGGVTALRSGMTAGALQSVITQGLMAADDRERASIAAALTTDDQRRTIEAIISSFRSAPDKNASSMKTARTLGSLGIEAVEPLLEVLRSVKPSTIQSNGSVKEEDKGSDGPPAVALTRMPGGLEKIKAICPPEEYERILVRAHNYGDSANPLLNQALGEIATPKAIGRLLSVLWQSHWEAETRKPAREALVKTGKQAHEQLLKALEITAPANREFQTNIRKEVLSVLGESGDELCIPGIQAVLTSDPVVAENAKTAIEAIQKRCGVSLPAEISIPKTLPMKKIVKTGDAYIDDCFNIDFEEMVEERDWFKIAEAKAIPDTANAGLINEALPLAEELRRKYPDFYFGYYWLAVLYRKQKRYDEARNVLLDGLKSARSKQNLCTALGDMEWEKQNLSEAVKWWIKSITVQLGSQYVTDYVAFLKLSYVAESFGIRLASLELRAWVDRLRSGQIRLNAQAANELYAATSRQGNPTMRLAIENLESHYLAEQ